MIRNLLVKEASKRLSAEAVLSHPWIKVADEDCDIEKRYRALKTSGIIRR
jgi:MAP kinase interacting serine/threonine kinase